MNRLLAAVHRRRLIVGAGAAFALLAGLAGTTPGAFGAYSAKVTNSTDTAASAPYFHCADALAADSGSALFQWPLGDASGSTTAADASGNGRTGAYQGTVTASSTTPMGCPRDAGTAWQLDGSTNYADYATSQSNPQTFSLEAEFQTTVKAGVLIGFASTATGTTGQYDRMLYIGADGRLEFGIYSSGYHVLSSSAVVTDGTWHHVVATLSPSGGTTLYLDGKQVAADPTSTAAESTTGYWRVGWTPIGGGWPDAPTSGYFSGRMRNAAVYTAVLSAAQVRTHAAASF